MKNSWKIIVVILVSVVFIAGVWRISVENSLINAYEDVEYYSSEILNQMKSRNEKTPNLVATIKGYSKHEKEIFTQIAEARSELGTKIQIGDLQEANEAYAKLNSSTSRLLVISENYPELKADKHYTMMIDELLSSQSKIDNARRKYNKSVRDFNAKIKRFPTSIIANKKGYTEFEFLDVPKEDLESPVVNFD